MAIENLKTSLSNTFARAECLAIDIRNSISDTVDDSLSGIKKLYVSVTGFLSFLTTAGLTIAAITAPVPTAIALAMFWIMNSAIDEACEQIERDTTKSKDSREREKALHLLKKYGALPQNAIVKTPYIEIQIDSLTGLVTGKVLHGDYEGKSL